MDKKTYLMIEWYMLECMDDAAHDPAHVYRVLFNALDIARFENRVDYDILIVACLLHDIGRREQFVDPALDHAEVGGDKAYRFLTDHGFSDEFAQRVKACIVAHRFRKEARPESVEAKILFDADKLDVAGAMGIARTLLYKGDQNEPLYSLDENGQPLDGGNANEPQSFFKEYKIKLERLYDRFYTERGKNLATERRAAAIAFYEALHKEVGDTYCIGAELLRSVIDE